KARMEGAARADAAPRRAHESPVRRRKHISLDDSSLRLDVLVQPEEVLRVVLSLQRHQPLVLRGAVDLSAVRACFGYIVDVAPCGHEWFDLSDRGSSPRDPLLIVGRIGPCELRGD